MKNGHKIKTESLPKLLVILGPTASGKSYLAVHLAKKFNGELVSADSRQVYREMNIATAKLKPPKGIKQWMVNVVEPNKIYTLQNYKKEAIKVINDIDRRGKLPILVGGTALYIYAVTQNWEIPEVKPNKKLRAEFEKKLKTKGLSYLVRELKKLNPEISSKTDLQNPRRVIRALEVARFSSGREFKKVGLQQFNVCKIGLSAEALALKKRLKKRTEIMWRQGLVKESKKLFKKYPLSLPSMSGIGYKEVADYIFGEISKEKCIELIITRSYQYSKRQMTWWKRDKEINWVNSYKESVGLINSWLK